MKPFNILEHPIVFQWPRLTPPYSWAGHIPFAYLAISLIRPRQLVELGTHSGNSYLAFCQAVLAADVGTECFAVDTWEGDDHATQYGGEIYTALDSYHAPRYSEFSTLLRKTFDDALADFDGQGIDLLHIDGLHTYEAVKHDFETWLPKLSSRAVVLMHDISVKDRDFGVWRYFEELSKRYRTFGFEHSNGLGIVCVGEVVPEAFRAFLDAADAAPDAMRGFFEGMASTVVDTRTGLARLSCAMDRPELPITAKLFHRSHDDIFSEHNCAVASVGDTDGRLRLVFNLSAEANVSFLRVDPADCPGVYGICGIRLVAAAGEVMDVTDFPRRVRSIVGEELTQEPPAFVRFVSLGSDPSVEFDLSDLELATSGFITERVEVDIVYYAVLSDEVPAYLARIVDEATLEARAKARTLDHVVNLLGEHASTSLGLVSSVAGLERTVENVSLEARTRAETLDHVVNLLGEHASTSLGLVSSVAGLERTVEEVTLEARTRAETLDHVVNLLGEHASTSLGLVSSVAGLERTVEEVTLEARTRAKTLDHVVNLLGEHADTSLGLVSSIAGLERGLSDHGGALSHAGELLGRLDRRCAELGLANTAIKEAIGEIPATVSSSVGGRQARMELEMNLANDAFHEQVEGLRAYVDSLQTTMSEVGEKAGQLGPRISEAESSLVTRMEACSQTMERTGRAIESQMAILDCMAVEQERTTAFLEAMHMKLDSRNPLNWIRRLFGRQR
ncbi:class I SAM-dependent methyltransferase [Luteimonas sp. A478]